MTMTNSGKDRHEIAYLNEIIEYIDDGAFDDYAKKLAEVADAALYRLIDGGYMPPLSWTRKTGYTVLAINGSTPPPSGSDDTGTAPGKVFTRNDVKVGHKYRLVTSRGGGAWWSGCVIEVNKLNPARLKGTVIEQPVSGRKGRNYIGTSVNGPYSLIAEEVH